LVHDLAGRRRGCSDFYPAADVSHGAGHFFSPLLIAQGLGCAARRRRIADARVAQAERLAALHQA
jgi:hypothetical protein